MILSKLKIWAIACLGFLATFFGLKHYRDKSKRLERDLSVANEVHESHKEIVEEQNKVRKQNDERMQSELDKADAGDRSHFERDPFASVRDED